MEASILLIDASSGGRGARESEGGGGGKKGRKYENRRKKREKMKRVKIDNEHLSEFCSAGLNYNMYYKLKVQYTSYHLVPKLL